MLKVVFLFAWGLVSCGGAFYFGLHDNWIGLPPCLVGIAISEFCLLRIGGMGR